MESPDWFHQVQHSTGLFSMRSKKTGLTWLILSNRSETTWGSVAPKQNSSRSDVEFAGFALRLTPRRRFPERCDISTTFARGSDRTATDSKISATYRCKTNNSTRKSKNRVSTTHSQNICSNADDTPSLNYYCLSPNKAVQSIFVGSVWETAYLRLRINSKATLKIFLL